MAIYKANHNSGASASTLVVEKAWIEVVE